MVGKGTALADNPLLTNRWWYGPSPRRIVADTHLALPAGNLIFSGKEEVLVLNGELEGKKDNLTYVQVKLAANGQLQVQDILHQLYLRGIQSLLLEGGSALLGSFLASGLWDKAFVIQATGKYLGGGLPAPVIPRPAGHTFRLANDIIYCYQNYPA
jgi:diaminohydroxyphosphoribosylaminopyrimidine deaminase/5-amino-6-(5-phosphoribosylamino)uracil reductase